MPEGQTQAYDRRVEADIGVRVDRRVRSSVESRRAPFAFVRSPEFGLVFSYLRPKFPVIVSLSFLNVLQTTVEAALLIALFAFIQILFEGTAGGMDSIDLLGYKVSIPFQSLVGDGQGGLVVFLGVLLALMLVWAVLNLTQNHVTFKLQRGFIVEVRQDILDKMLNLNISYFTDTKSGDTAYLQNAIVGRFSALISTLQNLISSLLNLAVVFVILVQLSAPLTGLLGALSLCLYLLTGALRRRARSLSFAFEEQSRRAASTFLEIIYGIRLVKLGGQEGRAREKYLDEMREREYRLLILNDHYALAGGLTKLGGPLVLVLAAWGVSLLAGLSLVENIGFALGYFLVASRALDCITTILSARLRLSVMYPHWSMVAEFLLDDAYVDGPVETTRSQRPLKEIRHSLSVENLGFSYNEQGPVLNDVSLEFRKGTITALVGLSGSGKSTLLEILARFRSPTSGRVCIDGVDVFRYDVSSYRKRIGYVTQDMVIFNDTILENIRYLRPQATEAEVERAVRLAMAHEFIAETENGYQTEIGERGLKVSGGERQRIALARVFLQDPVVMLLDEATNAADLYTEAKIFESLMGLKSDKIIVVAAHRLSAIRDFDNIVVIHQGRVLEEGTHEELMKHRALYYNLYKLQEYSRESNVDSLLRY